MEKKSKITEVKKQQFHEVKNSPFTIFEDNKVFKILVGNNIADKRQFKSLDSAVKYIKSKPYELIFTTCIILFNKLRDKELSEQFKMDEK